MGSGWVRNCNVWVLTILPDITVEPAYTAESTKTQWGACFCGKPIPAIPEGCDSRKVMQDTLKYFEARIEL